MKVRLLLIALCCASALACEDRNEAVDTSLPDEPKAEAVDARLPNEAVAANAAVSSAVDEVEPAIVTAEQTNDYACTGKWTYKAKSADTVGFNVSVERSGIYSMAFADMGSDEGRWEDNGRGNLHLTSREFADEKFFLHSCLNGRATIDFHDGRSFPIKKGTSNFVEND